MAVVDLNDVVFLGIVTVAACYQMATFAMKVGDKRRKFKIEPPITDGDPEFVRAFRAQQNSVEYFGMFLACLWMAGLFFHQVPAALVGLYYMYGRQRYFTDYVNHPKSRVPGFQKSVMALRLFLAMGVVGMTHCLLQVYAGIDLKFKLYSLFLRL